MLSSYSLLSTSQFLYLSSNNPFPTSYAPANTTILLQKTILSPNLDWTTSSSLLLQTCPKPRNVRVHILQLRLRLRTALQNLPQASKYASTHTTTTAPSLEMCEYKYYNYRCGCVCVHQKTACGKECPPVPTKVSPPKRQCAKCLRKKREARAEVKAQFAAWKGFVCNDSNEPPSEPVSPRSKPDEQAES